MRDLINIVESQTPSCPYSKWQMALLKSMVLKDVPMYRVVGIWWDHAPVIPGFARISAPEIDGESKAKCLALYRFGTGVDMTVVGSSWTRDQRNAQSALFCAGMFGWEAAFPDDFKRLGSEPLKEVFQFDPRSNDLSEYLDGFSLNSPQFSVASNLRTLDCVRLSNSREEWDGFVEWCEKQRPEQEEIEFRVYWRHPGQKDIAAGDNMFIRAKNVREARKKARTQLDGMFIGTKPKIAWVAVKGPNGWEAVD